MGAPEFDRGERAICEAETAAACLEERNALS